MITRMKGLTLFFLFIGLAVFLGVFTAVTAIGAPLVEAQAAVMTAPPDPYEQLIASREADNGRGTVLAVTAVLVVVLVGVAWYALSDRTTKLVRALNTARRPVRRTSSVQMQPMQMQPVQSMPYTALPEVSEV